MSNRRMITRGINGDELALLIWEDDHAGRHGSGTIHAGQTTGPVVGYLNQDETTGKWYAAAHDAPGECRTSRGEACPELAAQALSRILDLA